MPPHSTDDGLRAALKVRSQLPRTGVVMLSQHLSRQYALDLLATGPSSVGYLLNQHTWPTPAASPQICGCRHRRHDA
ncbi:MAG: hypothetical protein M3N32_06790 [Actinomycetota bacterium]|nr:hypothetical protein [Actinomycetota bacterium]